MRDLGAVVLRVADEGGEFGPFLVFKAHVDFPLMFHEMAGDELFVAGVNGSMAVLWGRRFRRHAYFFAFATLDWAVDFFRGGLVGSSTACPRIEIRGPVTGEKSRSIFMMLFPRAISCFLVIGENTPSAGNVNMPNKCGKYRS